MQFTSNMSKLEDPDFADGIVLISTNFKTIADKTTIERKRRMRHDLILI